MDTSTSKIPPGYPRERKLFQELIPLPFLNAFKNPRLFIGIPWRQARCSKGALNLSLSALQQPVCKASKWSSNWHLTSRGNLISPVKSAGTLSGSNGRGKKWPVKSWRLLLLLLFTGPKTTSHTQAHLSCVMVLSKNCTITLLELI